MYVLIFPHLGQSPPNSFELSSKPLLKYNILSEGLYVLIVAVYIYIDDEKQKVWILQCKMCQRRTFLFGTEFVFQKIFNIAKNQ